MKILSEIGTDYPEEETVPLALPFPIPKLPGPNLLGVMPLWWEHSCFHGNYGRGVWGSGGHSGIYRVVFKPVQILHGCHEDSGPHWLNGNELIFPGWFIWALNLPQSTWILYFLCVPLGTQLISKYLMADNFLAQWQWSGVVLAKAAQASGRSGSLWVHRWFCSRNLLLKCSSSTVIILNSLSLTWVRV